jgi:hypothetical protein
MGASTSTHNYAHESSIRHSMSAPVVTKKDKDITPSIKPNNNTNNTSVKKVETTKTNNNNTKKSNNNEILFLKSRIEKELNKPLLEPVSNSLPNPLLELNNTNQPFIDLKSSNTTNLNTTTSTNTSTSMINKNSKSSNINISSSIINPSGNNRPSNKILDKLAFDFSTRDKEKLKHISMPNNKLKFLDDFMPIDNIINPKHLLYGLNKQNSIFRFDENKNKFMFNDENKQLKFETELSLTAKNVKKELDELFLKSYKLNNENTDVNIDYSNKKTKILREVTDLYSEYKLYFDILNSAINPVGIVCSKLDSLTETIIDRERSDIEVIIRNILTEIPVINNVTGPVNTTANIIELTGDMLKKYIKFMADSFNEVYEKYKEDGNEEVFKLYTTSFLYHMR